jgi:hypothetical protein
MTYSKVKSRHLPGWAEENHKISHPCTLQQFVKVQDFPCYMMICKVQVLFYFKVLCILCSTESTVV